MTGKILWFNVEKGTGEICCSDDSRLFFLAEDLLFKSIKTNISIGAKVEFTISETQLFGKERAQRILVIENKKSKNSDSQILNLDGQS